MPVGIRYQVNYIHKRKEVLIRFQVGTMPPIEIVMGAEAFCQDIAYIINDKGLAKFFANVKASKDLPIDHNFGAGGGDIKFDQKEWEDKMEGGE